MKIGCGVARARKLAGFVVALTMVLGVMPQIVMAEGGFASSSSALSSTRPLAAGEAVRFAPLAGGPLPLVLRAPADEPAWLFYEDRGRGTLYQHDGRVALVGVRSGETQISDVIPGPPVVAGQPARFLPGHKLSFQPSTAPKNPFGKPAFPPAAPTQPIASAARLHAAAQLGAQRVCFVRAAGTLGSFASLSPVSRSGAAFARLTGGLSRLAPGLVAGSYRGDSGADLSSYTQGLIDANGCREVALYVAGGGYQADGRAAIAIGTEIAGNRVQTESVGAEELRALLRSRPGVAWNLILDAPGAGAVLTALRGEGNLVSAQASGSKGQAALIAAKPAAPSKRLLKFTRGLLAGLVATLDDEAAVGAAVAERDGNRAPTLLSALLTRSFQRGIAPPGFQRRGVEPQYFVRGSGDTGTFLPGPAAKGGQPAPLNKAPVVSNVAGPVAYTENGPAVPVAPALTVTDADSATLTGASVTIPSGATAGEDLLEFADQNGIAGSWSAGNSTLTLSGTAPVAAYQAALRSVAYRNLSDGPLPGPRRIEFSASDGSATSAGTDAEVDVTVENDAPDVQLSGGSASYTESAAPTAIDVGLTVVDPDSTQIDSATVAILAGFAAGEDVLELSTPVAGIGASYDAGTGVLELTGPATTTEFEAALRAVAYSNTSADPDTAARAVAFTLIDAEGDSGPARSRGLDVVAVNDAPQLSTTSGPLAYTENDPATAVDPGLAASDADSAQLTGATVSVASGYVSGADQLGFTDQSGITGSWDTGSGALTLSGNASVADYQAALRTVTYRNLSDDPAPGSRSIDFRVSDGTSQSAIASRGVTVTAVNDAPDLSLPTAGALVYEEKDPATAIDPDAVLADPDSASFSSATATISGGFVSGEDVLSLLAPVSGITDSYDAGTGVLTLTGPASRADFEAALRAVAYRNTSNNPSTALRTVTLQAEDSAGASTPQRTRQVAVGPANDAPEATTTGTALAYAENDPATAVDSGLTVEDPDSADLSSATVQLTGGYVEGEDVLAFPGAAGITGSWEASTGKLTLTGSATLAAYQAALRSVTYANLSDNPPAGTRTATIVVNDGLDPSEAATRSIEVSVANDAPDVQLSGGSASYTENAAPTAIDAGLTVVDPDSAEIASATVALTGGFQSTEDALSLTAPVSGISDSYNASTGVLTLTGPATKADFQAALRAVAYANSSEKPKTAARTVSFTLTDPEGASGAARTRTLNVTAVNDTPVAAADGSGSTDEATVLTVASPGLLGNDSDVDGDPLTVVAVEGQAANVGATITTGKGATVKVNANGSYSYDPTGSTTLRAMGEGESTTDSFAYTAGDGAGGTSTATVTVTVIGLPDPPEATNDSYSGVGNTTLAVGQTGPSGQAFKQLSGSVLDNDTDADTPHANLTVDAGTSATTGGGSVTIAGDGKFTYMPPIGTSGSTDTFTYTVSDGKQTDTGTVSIPLTGRVWYVDNSAGSGGSGRSSTPFNTLAAAASASSTGDTIYVFKGDGNNTGQNSGVTLKANQRLLGQAVDLVIGGDTLFDGSAAQRSKIGNGSGTGVTLATGSRVEGLEISASGGTAISGGAGVNGSTLADLVVGANAGGIALVGTTGTFALSNLTVIANNSSPFVAENAGTIQFAEAGTISLSANGAKGLTASGVALAGVIDSLSVTSSGSGGVALTNTTGSLAFGDVSIGASGSPGFFANNAAGLSIPAAGTVNVSTTGTPAVDVRSSSSPALAFDSVSSTNSTGPGFNVDTVSGGSVTAAGGTIAGAAGAAVDVNAGNGTVTYGGTVNDGNGRPLEVTGRTGGTVTVSGNITEDDTGILVSGNSGGTTEISGAAKSISTGTGNAVALTNNTGHTVNITGGGLALTTTSGKGLVATGGGAVTVQGSNNTATATTGAAVEVANTTIGAADVTFRSVAANGGANGIVLNTTGSAGGLHVTGNGTADSGGVIQNMVGADGTNAGVGAYLNSTADVSLSRMRFSNAQGHAIRGTTVNGFSLTNSTVNGTNGTNDAVDEGSISLTGLTGTAALNETTVQGGYEDNIDIFSSSGTLNLTMNKLTVGANSTLLGGNGVLLQGSGTANMTTTVSESSFTSSREDLFQHVVVGHAKSDFTFSNNELSNSQPEKLPGSSGIIAQAGGTEGSELIYRISGNKVRDINGLGIFVQKATGISSAKGRISNNQVGTPGVEFSGGFSPIAVEARGQGSGVTSITGNTVRQYRQTGIAIISGEKGSADNGTVSMDATVTGNTIVEAMSVAGAGFRDEIADPESTVTNCLDLKENTMTNASKSSDIRILHSWPQTIYRLVNYAGAPFDAAAVEAYFSGRNTVGSALATVPESGNGFTSAASCTQPPA